MARQITVEIVADTRDFRRALIRVQQQLARSWWRRLALRIAMWRIDRETV